MSRATGTDGTRFFGENIAERAIEVAYPKMRRMPAGNKGFDFLSPECRKIEVKAAHDCGRCKKSKWQYILNSNRIADVFIFMAFADDVYPVLCNVWRVPGSIINHRHSIGIRDTAKWQPFKLDIVDKLQPVIDAEMKNWQ